MDQEKTVLTPSTLLQGRYRVVGRLGRGGMAVVYEAVDENLQCRVAVKETFATDAERGLRRAFRHEAQLLANVRHPAFPRVTDYFEQGDGLFFVMDFIHGDDLAKRLELMGRPFPLEKVLKWADRLLDALAELHAVRPPIVHKDIKPSNIKLCEDEVYLLDFGLAKGSLGLMSTVQGDDYSHVQGYTPHFASPEQRSSWGTTPRSDLYSLGATLWNLLTNELPPDSTLRNYEVNNGDPDPLRPAHTLNPSVPPEVSAVLEQAMSLNPARRHADAAEMRSALREAVEAPLRAQAERARRAEEARTRREGEEAGRAAAEAEFNDLLEEERAARADAVGELERRHRSELDAARDELGRVRGELAQVKQAADQYFERVDEEAARHQDAVLKLDKELNEERLRRVAAEGALDISFRVLEGELRDDGSLPRGEWDTSGLIVSADRERLHGAAAALRRLRDSLASKVSLLREADEKASQLAAEKDAALRKAEQAEGQLLESQRAPRRMGPLTTLAAGVVGVIAGAVGLALLSSKTSTPPAKASDPPAVVKVGDTASLLVEGVYLDMVKIRGGTFMMGSPNTETARGDQERPARQVTVPDFSIGRYEVTQAQWRAVTRLPKVQIDLSADISLFKGDDLPVDSVRWAEAVEFCARLSNATGLKYRLPTEAEWEYAARGGIRGAFTADADAMAWTADNSCKQRIDSVQIWNSVNKNNDQYSKMLSDNGCQTHSVGQKRSNAFGLYDMLGNAREWCLDAWHPNYKGTPPTDGSEWVDGADTTRRVGRGGSWYNSTYFVHPATRLSLEPDGRFSDMGFRVVSLPPK